jgi:hypothetical protein
MANDLVELIVKVGIQIADWLTNRKKEKKGDSTDDRQGTAETK